MKINKEDLPFLDLIWFAVDRFNKVIELTSGGNAILPDFIIKSVEDVEFQRELPNRRVIEILHDKKVMRIFAECGAVPRSIHSEPSFPSEASTPARCAFLPFSIADDHRRAKGRNADFPQKSERKKQRAGETTKRQAKELAMQRKPFYN